MSSENAGKKKAARIASLDARMAAAASARMAGRMAAASKVPKQNQNQNQNQQRKSGPTTTTTTTRGKPSGPPGGGRGGRGNRPVENDAEDEDEGTDPSTSYYAPLTKEARERATATAATEKFAGSRKRAKLLVEAVTSDDKETRRLYAETYARDLLATRAEDGDADEVLRGKLSRDKALVLDDATRALDHGDSRAKALRERFAKANAAKLTATAMRKRGMYGIPLHQCKWSAFAPLRASWEKYARALVRDARSHDDVSRRLTRGIDLHGAVIKIIRHARTPDVVGREGVVFFINARSMWLASRKRDAEPLRVFIDGGVFQFTLDDRVVRLSSEDILASLPNSSP